MLQTGRLTCRPMTARKKGGVVAGTVQRVVGARAGGEAAAGAEVADFSDGTYSHTNENVNSWLLLPASSDELNCFRSTKRPFFSWKRWNRSSACCCVGARPTTFTMMCRASAAAFVA